jgi:hypothetical protein
MKIVAFAIGASLALVVTLAAHIALTSGSPTSCQPVMVLSVGGCDGDGLCAVIVGNQQGQIKKDKLSYPVAGTVEELCEPVP